MDEEQRRSSPVSRGRYCLTRLGWASSWPCISCRFIQGTWPVLINQSQPFISPPHFLFTLWGGASPRGQRLRRDDQLSPSPTVTSIVSAPSLAEHMTDIWMAGGVLRPRRRSTEESSTFTPSPTSSLSLCFDSFICKSRDKTYGANLQQINGDPGWLSTLDIRSERCDTPSTCLCLKLCLIH